MSITASIASSIRRHPHVIGYTLVILLATSGTATAAGALHIHSRDIVNGQVKTADLGKNSVTSAKVRENALTGADINELSLTNVGNSVALAGLPGAAYARAPRVVFNVGVANTIQPAECLVVFAFGVGAAGDAGKIVSGFITDAGGTNPPPDLNNLTLFLPGTVFKTSQGGTIGFIQVCNPTTSVKNLPAGWQLKTKTFVG